MFDYNAAVADCTIAQNNRTGECRPTWQAGNIADSKQS